MNRTLYCYSLVLETKSGCAEVSWKDVFERFRGIQEQNVYELDRNTSALLIIESLTDEEVKGHFNWLRYDSPRILSIAHQIERFISLAEDENIIERAHFKYFPKHDVFIAEYNHYGARTFGRLGPYVTHFIPELSKCELRPYVRTDAFERAMKQSGILRKLSVSVATPGVEVLEDCLRLGVRETLGDLSTIDTEILISVCVSAKRRKLPSQTQNWIIKLVQRLRDSVADRYGFQHVKLVGDEEVNLLRSDYYQTVRVLTVDQNSRVVRDSDIYSAIDSFYQERVIKDLPTLQLGG